MDENQDSFIEYSDLWLIYLSLIFFEKYFN